MMIKIKKNNKHLPTLLFNDLLMCQHVKLKVASTEILLQLKRGKAIIRCPH